MSRASLSRSSISVVGIALFALYVVVALALPSILSSYYLFIATGALITAMMVWGLGVVTGRAGMLVLCQVAFAAVGAYAFVWLRIHLGGLGFLPTIVVAAIVTALIGMIVGLPALRLRGINLGILTLVFGVTANVVLTTVGFPGQDEAFVVDRPDWLFDDGRFFQVCAVVFLLLAIGGVLLDRSRLGAGLLAVRRSERATAALGHSVPRAKIAAFALCAGAGGLAGALFVAQQGTVTVESFSPMQSLILFALCIMMGARYAGGALFAGVLGAFMPVLLDELSVSQNVGNLLFAVGAVLGLKGGRGAAEDLRYQLGRRFGKRWPERAVSDRVTAVTAAGTAPVPVAVAVPASGEAPPALEIRGLTVSYGSVKALDGVDVVVPPRSVVAVIGPNGAGKSTLIDCVTGFIRSYDGEILVAGERIDALPAHVRAVRGLRRSFQQDRSIPDLSVEQYLRLAMTHDQSEKTSSDDLDEMLAFFDGPDRRRKVSGVDVGSRRLVEVVAAVAARPTVALLDEPAAGLAAAESRRLAAQIAKMPARFGLSVVLVEHDMELVQAACSSMTVVDFGKVIASGPPQEVLADSRVMKAYLGQEVMA